MEVTVLNEENKQIRIMKEDTDPLCLRASIGGTKEQGYYVVYRGDSVQEIEDMLKETYMAFKSARKQIEQASSN